MGHYLAKMSRKLDQQIDHRLHQRGYELWRTGVQPAVIREQLKITHRQWKWLLEEGDTKADPPMPAYRLMLIDEVCLIRTSASEAAVSLATEGVQVLRQRMKNAKLANELVNGILQHTAHAIVGMRESGNGSPEDLAQALPRPATQEMLKILARYCDLATVAHAYRTIYGDVAAQRALYPLADAPRRDDGQPLDQLEGEIAIREEFLAADTVAEVVTDMSEWSDEQLIAFAAGEDEPPPR